MENITAKFESLPMWAKVVLLLVLGTLISPIYRILRYFETKNTKTLVAGILMLVIPCVGTVLGIVDVVTELTQGKITVLAD
jgi:hypothetical protein